MYLECLFASIVGKSTGFLRLIIDTIHLISKERKEKYDGKYDKDLMYINLIELKKLGGYT